MATVEPKAKRSPLSPECSVSVDEFVSFCSIWAPHFLLSIVECWKLYQNGTEEQVEAHLLRNRSGLHAVCQELFPSNLVNLYPCLFLLSRSHEFSQYKLFRQRAEKLSSNKKFCDCEIKAVLLTLLYCIARGANVLRDTSVACFNFVLGTPAGCTRYAHGPIRPCLPGERMTQCLDFVAPDPNLELHTLGGYGLLIPVDERYNKSF